MFWYFFYSVFDSFLLFNFECRGPCKSFLISAVVYFFLLNNLEEYHFGLAVLVIFLFKSQIQAFQFRIFFGSDLLNAEFMKYQNVFVS